MCDQTCINLSLIYVPRENMWLFAKSRRINCDLHGDLLLYGKLFIKVTNTVHESIAYSIVDNLFWLIEWGYTIDEKWSIDERVIIAYTSYTNVLKILEVYIEI